MLDNNRLIHSLEVARKMLEIARKRGLTIEEQEICFSIVFNHDIGYEFTSNNLEHKSMAQLFNVEVNTINYHLKEIKWKSLQIV